MKLQKIDAEINQINLLNPYNMFKFSIRSEVTRKYYERRIRRFFDFIEFNPGNDIEQRCNNFAEKARNDVNWALIKIIAFLQFEKERSEKGEISPATLYNFVKALKLFCEMSDITITWKRIVRGLPRPRMASNDRAPTIEEIQKLLGYPDRRIKPIVYIMASSGIRIGAFDYLQWKHIIPIREESNKIIAAKIIVYAGDNDEYYSFITPEAYKSINEWMDFRASYGESITGDSWVMRDLWQTTNITYGANLGLATYPKKLKSTGIKRIIERALWEQGLRRPLAKGEKRHEWKAAHGFRKFYKTRTEQVMKPINVEITMGHNIGISASYYKPTEREVSDDYLKAVDLLTINDGGAILQKQLTELLEKNRDSKYFIEGKLNEKDKKIEVLSKKYEQVDATLQAILRALENSGNSGRNEIAKQLVTKGIYRPQGPDEFTS